MAVLFRSGSSCQPSPAGAPSFDDLWHSKLGTHVGADTAGCVVKRCQSHPTLQTARRETCASQVPRSIWDVAIEARIPESWAPADGPIGVSPRYVCTIKRLKLNAVVTSFRFSFRYGVCYGALSGTFKAPIWLARPRACRLSWASSLPNGFHSRVVSSCTDGGQ